MSQTMNALQTKFWLGQIVLTKAVTTELVQDDVLRALTSHSLGMWGDLCPDDKALNDTALESGGRLLSAYRDRKGVKFWIVTEANRNSTTVLLPEHY